MAEDEGDTLEVKTWFVILQMHQNNHIHEWKIL